jgi:hypothetical protein
MIALPCSLTITKCVYKTLVLGQLPTNQGAVQAIGGNADSKAARMKMK